jgi:hypothetical protein
MRPRPDFKRWLPYRKDISLVGLTHICVHEGVRASVREMETET